MSSVPIFSRGIHGSDNRHKQDYYKVLGVNKNADAKDIKKAYYQVIITISAALYWFNPERQEVALTRLLYCWQELKTSTQACYLFIRV